MNVQPSCTVVMRRYWPGPTTGSEVLIVTSAARSSTAAAGEAPTS